MTTCPIEQNANMDLTKLPCPAENLGMAKTFDITEVCRDCPNRAPLDYEALAVEIEALSCNCSDPNCDIKRKFTKAAAIVRQKRKV